MNQYNLGIGVCVYAPTYDANHYERIDTCLNSIRRAVNRRSVPTHVTILLNCSEGFDRRVKALIMCFVADLGASIIEHYDGNSIAKCYNLLLKDLYNRGCSHLVVYADDYVLPENHFKKVVYTNGYTMPIGCFLPQQLLDRDIPYQPQWNRGVWGIESGVSIEDVNTLSETMECKCLYPIKKDSWNSTNSIETTIFKREVFEKCGFIDTEFSHILFNWDFYRRVNEKFVGYINLNTFVFHYGKGATKAVHKKTADEKYTGSTMEVRLLNDINHWNTKWNDTMRKWW